MFLSTSSLKKRTAIAIELKFICSHCFGGPTVNLRETLGDCDIFNPCSSFLLSLFTCQICEPQLPQAVGAILGVVEEDREGETSFIKAVSSDDPELSQRNLLKVVHSNEDIAGHLADGLEDKKKVHFENLDVQISWKRRERKEGFCFLP